MSISKKIKALNNKIEQNRAQYDLDRQTAKVSALSSGNVSKYDFLSDKDLLPEKDLPEKAAATKRFEYSLLDKELKAQTDISKKQYQKLENDYKLSIIGKYSKSNLIYDANYSFYKYYCDTKKFDSLSFRSKYSFLSKFLDDINKFSDVKPRTENIKKKKTKVFHTASELRNKFLNKYFDECYDLEGKEKEELGFKFIPINLKIKGYTIINFIKKYHIMILLTMILINLLIFETCHTRKQ